MNCPNCSREVRGNFCTNCGTRVPAADPSEADTMTFQQVELEAAREREAAQAAAVRDRSEAPTVVFQPSDLRSAPGAETADPSATMRMGAAAALQDAAAVPVHEPAARGAVIDPAVRKLQPWLVLAALSTTLFGALHHLEHYIRGDTGWPIAGGMSPYAPSFLLYPLIAVGLYFTLRGRLVPGIWLVVGGVVSVLISLAHLRPGAPDSFSKVYNHYTSHVAGVFANLDVVFLVASGIWLLILTFRARRITKSWF